jgi:hypothetical protein
VKKTITFHSLRVIALVVVLAGAGGALDMVLHAGRNNHSLLLPMLFVCWVLSPFVALLVANVAAKRWPIQARVTLYGLMLFLTFGSLLGYSGIFSPTGTKNAFVFLVVPLISWLLIAIVIPIALSRSRRRSRMNESA